MNGKEIGMESGLETKFCRLGGDLVVSDGAVIEGYASLSVRPIRAVTLCRQGPMTPA